VRPIEYERLVTKRQNILLWIVIAVVAFAVYFRMNAWPWIAEPDDAAVASAWSAVEKAAKESAPAPAADARFDALLAATKSAKKDLEALAKQGNARTDETLPQTVKAAFDALEAWAGGAGIDESPPVCVPSGTLDFIAITYLSQVALVTPPIASHAAMLTTLSERLRRRGGLLHYAVGMKILDRLLERAALNPQGLPPYLKDTHADGRELRAAVARGHVCDDALFEGAGGRLGMADAKEVPWVARPFVTVSRERRMVRLFFGEPMRAASEVDDPAEIAKRLAVRPSEMPKSVGVRAMAITPPFETILPVIKRYNELRLK
jgi:hypothetical protein